METREYYVSPLAVRANDWTRNFSLVLLAVLTIDLLLVLGAIASVAYSREANSGLASWLYVFLSNVLVWGQPVIVIASALVLFSLVVRSLVCAGHRMESLLYGSALAVIIVLAVNHAVPLGLAPAVYIITIVFFSRVVPGVLDKLASAGTGEVGEKKTPDTESKSVKPRSLGRFAKSLALFITFVANLVAILAVGISILTGLTGGDIAFVGRLQLVAAVAFFATLYFAARLNSRSRVYKAALIAIIVLMITTALYVALNAAAVSPMPGFDLSKTLLSQVILVLVFWVVLARKL